MNSERGQLWIILCSKKQLANFKVTENMISHNKFYFKNPPPQGVLLDWTQNPMMVMKLTDRKMM